MSFRFFVCRKEFRLLIVLVTLSIDLFSQSDDLFQQIIPPTPEAASLGKYGAHPVGHYNGTALVNIPLHEISTGNIKLEISASYLSSGVKVEDIPSRLGVDWVLNAGGVITRSVRGGYNDDMPKRFWSCPDGDYDQGNCEVSGYFKLGNPNDIGGVDFEPDLFFYNFNGKSGTFSFDRDQNVTFNPHRQWNIQHFLNDGSEYAPGAPISGITKFVITTDDGIKYTFSAVEKMYSYATCGDVMSSLLSQRSYPVAWYLTEILDQATGKRVTIKYKTITTDIAYDVNVSETFNTSLNYGLPGCCLMDSYNPPCTNPTKLQFAKIIERIEFEGGTVVFDSSTPRQDLVGDFEMNEVKVLDPSGLLKKRFSFDQDYAHQANCATAICKRLYLKGINEHNVFDGNDVKKHTFTYKNINELPARNSSEQDVFGYYKSNGASNLRPTIYVYPAHGKDIFSVIKRNVYQGSEYIISGNDRSPDDAEVQYGLLEIITYPTDGYTRYSYEPNEFHLWGENFKGGGARIAKVESCHNANECQLKEYSYKRADNASLSSGYVLGLPEFAYLCAVPSAGQALQDYYNSRTIVKNRNQAILGGGAAVSYSDVVEKQSGNGKTLFQFYSAAENPDQAPVYNYHSNFAGDCYEGLVSLLENYNKYPFFTNTSMSTRRGMPKRTAVFLENGQLIKEEIFLYNTLTKNTETVSMEMGFDYAQERLRKVHIQGSYSILADVTLLSQKTVNEYAAGTVLTTVHNYTYNGYDQMSQEEKLLGADVVVDTYKYSSDQTDAVSLSMKEKNILSPVVEREVSKNGAKISGLKSHFNTHAYIDQFGTQTVFPKTLLEEWTSDAGYITNGEILQFDERGNILQYQKRSGEKKSLLWGYDKRFPIAEVIDADFSQIACTSFESFTTIEELDGTDGGWLFPELFSPVSKTGARCLSGGTISKTGLPVGNYVLSFWAKPKSVSGTVAIAPNTGGSIAVNGETWSYHEIKLSNVSNVSLTLTDVYLDELRLYPEKSRVTTYTYSPLTGVTSVTDPNNDITYYEYDGFNRLIAIRDKDLNITKAFKYNYKN